jgi:SWI/SNF-related matrix-associated actin-dependent regulator of chromatin subfamily A-like protein 1
MAAQVKTRFFPAQIPGNCALCGKGYERLSIVGFFPQGQISHIKCVTDPPKLKTRKADANVVSLLGKRLEKVLPAGRIPKKYQVEFVEFCEEMRERIGAVRVLCGDDMGLGKTVEVILWLALHPEVSPVVFVVPNIVKLFWPRELDSWLPGKMIHVIDGKKPSRLPKADFYVINYDIVQYWITELRRVKPKCVIADECQNIKNPKAQRTIAVVGQTTGKNADTGVYLVKDVPHFICTSGTPIENRPSEFWPVIHRLRDDVWGSYWDFIYRYCDAKKKLVPFGAKRADGSRARIEILDTSGASNIVELHKLLTRHVMIRRLKTEVASELPEKQRSLIPVEIQNRKEYDRAYKDFLGWLKDSGADKATVDKAVKAEALVRVNALTRLAGVGKLAGVLEWVKDFMQTHNKLVVFCHHRSVGIALYEALEEFKPARLFGQLSARKTEDQKQRFQTQPECRIAICSHKKAGAGVTLHAASDMAIIELPWTPAKLDQSEDRIHRIGQQNTCMYYYLLAADTVEEDKAALIDSKRGVIGGLLDGTPADNAASLFQAMLEMQRAKIAP